jgi:hypothetical protein
MADTTPGPAEVVKSLDPVEQVSTVPAKPVNIQAKKVLDELLAMIHDGSISLVFVVGVGPGAAFSRNIGGSGNAYELAGLIELQKKELLDAIPQPTAPVEAPAAAPVALVPATPEGDGG